MVKYADYKFYTEEYQGTMPENSFDKHVIEASLYLNGFTFDRIKEPVIDEVKYACCKMCEVMAETDAAKIDGKEVSSVSNDGYSVSFVAGQDGTDVLTSKLYDIVRLYLPIELISWSCGGDCCE